MKKSGKEIQKVLKLKKVSVLSLSKKSGIKTADLNNILNEKREPTKQEFQLISKALDVPVTVFALNMIELKDVPDNKKEVFKALAPTIKNFIKGLMKDDVDENKNKPFTADDFKLTSADELLTDRYGKKGTASRKKAEARINAIAKTLPSKEIKKTTNKKK